MNQELPGEISDNLKMAQVSATLWQKRAWKGLKSLAEVKREQSWNQNLTFQKRSEGHDI